MANELQRIADDYYNRSKALVTEYRDYMGKQVEAAGTSITKSLNNVAQMQQAQILAQVASTNVLNQTLQQGFTGVSNQLGSMTASFSMGFARLENALDRMTDIMNNPLLTQSRELYRRAADRSKKGQFEEALEDIMAALEKDKTDYTAWFLQGKIYAFGASKYSNVIDLDKSLDALNKAAKYNEPNIADSADALKRQAEIYFYLGIAYYAKSNDQLRENKKTESSETLALARKSFEQSYKYSDGMLESLFNIARCKVIQGETTGALRDLETLVSRERNYCIKVYADDDFSGIGEQFNNLINKLRKAAFISAKNDYDRINSMKSQLTSLGGYTNEKVPSDFSEELPYFDILDYANDFKRIIPIIVKALREKNAAIEEANQKTREAKEAAERAAEYLRKQEQSERWIKAGRCQYCGGSLSFFAYKHNKPTYPWFSDHKCLSCGQKTSSDKKSLLIRWLFVIGEVLATAFGIFTMTRWETANYFAVIPFALLFIISRNDNYGFRKFFRITTFIAQVIVSIALIATDEEFIIGSIILLITCLLAYKLPVWPGDDDDY
ncbi:MAG: hypothetical protein LBQ93_03160 [Treponema sp.]|jgi:tetratricopeptide (TPR) repeat protein|nr:hypothetical protein [Treponema sp.]